MSEEYIKQEYNSLDELAEDFPVGMRFRFSMNNKISKIAQVEGVVWGLPLENGGPSIPSIVIRTDTGIGHVYPHEVQKVDHVG